MAGCGDGDGVVVVGPRVGDGRGCENTVACFVLNDVADGQCMEGKEAEGVENGVALFRGVLIPGEISGRGGRCPPGDGIDLEVDSGNEEFADGLAALVVEAGLGEVDVVGLPGAADLHLLGADLGGLGGGGGDLLINDGKTDEGIAIGAGGLGEVDGVEVAVVVAEELEAAVVDEANGVGGGVIGRIGFGIDEASASLSTVGGAASVVEGLAIAEAVGQGIAAGTEEGDGIGVCIDLQGWSALEGEAEVGEAGADGNAAGFGDRCDSGWDLGELETGSGGSGIKIEAAGLDGEVLIGFDAAAGCDGEAAIDVEVEGGVAGELTGDGGIA